MDDFVNPEGMEVPDFGGVSDQYTYSVDPFKGSGIRSILPQGDDDFDEYTPVNPGCGP